MTEHHLYAGVTLIHDGHPVSNNSIIALEDIPAGTALVCSTDRTGCCTGYNHAFWRRPSNVVSSGVFSTARSSSVLVANRTTQNWQTQHNGMWYCQIRNKYYGWHRIYVGIFSQGKYYNMHVHSPT